MRTDPDQRAKAKPLKAVRIHDPDFPLMEEEQRAVVVAEGRTSCPFQKGSSVSFSRPGYRLTSLTALETTIYEVSDKFLCTHGISGHI